MFDNSNIFDLTPSVPNDSCSLFNTQNTGKPFNKDPLETNAFFAYDKNSLYYKQRLLSTQCFHDYQRESQEITTQKARVVLPGKDKKSVKRRRHFFVIFFNEKKNEHRILNNFNQISLHLFNVKPELNPGISEIFYLCIALQLTRCINTSEPAAVFGFHGNIKVGVFKVPESTAVGLLFGWLLVISHWSLVGGFGAMMRFWCMDTGGMGRWGDGEVGI